MSNVKDAKPRIKTITLSDGIEREVRFTLNAMAEIEERYGSVQAAFDALENNSVKAARCILWAGLLHSDEGLTEQQVGNLIDISNMSGLMNSMTDALGEDSAEASTDGANGANVPNA